MLPLACYSPLRDFEIATDVQTCKFAYLVARIVETQYTDVDAAAVMVQTVLGDDAIVTAYPPASEIFPNCIVATKLGACFVFVTGTTTINQGALQGLAFGFGPINQGEYSTSAIYDAAATTIAHRIGDCGGGDCSRFVLIGHSYGGAAVYVLAAKLRVAVPDRRVELITFGMPKSGDSRLVAILEPLRQTHWTAFDDPVPYLPPEGTTFADFIAFVSPLLLLMWEGFARHKRRVVIQSSGLLEPTDITPMPLDVLFTLAQVIDAALDEEPFDGHFMSTYARRLRSGCKSIDADCDPFPYPPGPTPTGYDIRLTSLTFTADGTPYDVSLDGMWVDESGGVTYQTNEPGDVVASLYWVPYGEGVSNTLQLEIFVDLDGLTFAYFYWDLDREQVESGIVLDVPDSVDGFGVTPIFDAVELLQLDPFELPPLP